MNKVMIPGNIETTSPPIGLLPGKGPVTFLLLPPKVKPGPPPPIAGGFQMPLPDLPFSCDKDPATVHAWHCYLGSR